MNGRALLAWNLRRLRTARGVSQERLAADAEIDRAYISEIERLKGNATVDVLDRLARCLDTSLAEFFRVPTGSEKRPQLLPKGRKPAVKR